MEAMASAASSMDRIITPRSSHHFSSASASKTWRGRPYTLPSEPVVGQRVLVDGVRRKVVAAVHDVPADVVVLLAQHAVQRLDGRAGGHDGHQVRVRLHQQLAPGAVDGEHLHLAPVARKPAVLDHAARSCSSSTARR